MHPDPNSSETAEIAVSDVIDLREQKKREFALVGRQVLSSSERVLVYSQSQRVLQFLTGAAAAVQRSIQLFVCECRPKSPSAYQDAAAIAAALSSTEYKITVCPDVVGLNLLANNQIDRVVLGTHAIYCSSQTEPEDAHSYVNTCGTQAIAAIANLEGIPVEVIGERLKLEVATRESAESHFQSNQEEDLLQLAHALQQVEAFRIEIDHLNIGYDLVRVTDNTRVWAPD